MPPGQKHRRAATWGELLQSIGQGQYRGIILVSAFGYHSLGISYKQHPLYSGNKEKFLAAFLAEQRREEVTVLIDLAAVLKTNPGKMWLLTIIAKQDLWYPQRAEVVNFYTAGDYGNEVANVVAHNPRQFRHESAFVSLAINNFTTGKGERLQPNVEGYDHAAQVETLRALFESVDALRKWEVSDAGNS